MFPEELKARIAAARVVAVIVIDDAESAPSLAEALIAGGVTAVEVTLRTPAALEATRRIVAEFPDLAVGVGTILTPAQVAEARAAGALFGVSPGLNESVVEEARRIGLAFAPGVATPSEIEHALRLDCKLMKFFPAEPLGGLGYLKAIAAPYRHLGVSFVPLGGVSEANAASYAAADEVAAIGGSWIAPREVIRQADWPIVRENAARAVELTTAD